MMNEFSVIVTVKLADGSFRTFGSGQPPYIESKDISVYTDTFLKGIMAMHPQSKVISINHLPHFS